MVHSITLQTSDGTITDNDILGKISFAAPNETGSDAILVAASIFARAEVAFDADENQTELVFATASGASASPTAGLAGGMTLSSAGVLTLSSGGLVIPDGGNIGSASDPDAIAIANTGVVTFSAGINVSGGTIAGTIATATQNSITTMTGLVTVGALNTGSITSGFTSIDVGAGAITTTGLISGGSLDIDGNVDLDGKLTMGGNQDGYDLKVFGNGGGTTTLSGADAANKYWFWDESVDGMRLRGNFVQEQVPYTNTPSAIGTGISIIDIDWQLGNYYWIKLGDTHIDKIIFRNMKRGGKYILRIQQASPYRTVAWTALKNTDVVPDPDDSSDHFTEVRWVGGDAPTMSTGTTSTDVYGFLCTRSNGKGMDCFVVAQDLQEDGDH